MTIDRRDGSGTPFGLWLREQRGLDSQEFCLSVVDSDFWVHRYTPRTEKTSDVRQVIDHLMLVEVKSFLRDPDYAQRDTLTIIDQVCRLATTNKQNRRITRKLPDLRPGRVGARRVRFLGVHLLKMSGDRPDNSEEIFWDNKHQISETALVGIVRFDLDPDHPSRPLDTRRHHLRPASEVHPRLALVTKP